MFIFYEGRRRLENLTMDLLEKFGDYAYLGNSGLKHKNNNVMRPHFYAPENYVENTDTAIISCCLLPGSQDPLPFEDFPVCAVYSHISI